MISVCIATYNGERYIREQLASILSQLGAEDEVVISDDSSTDATLSIINSIGDERIRILNHNRFEGRFNVDYSTHNFENALKNSRGDIIFLADQDDVWLPGKVDKMTKALQNSDLAVCDCKVTDSSLNTISESYFAKRKFSRSILTNILRSSFLGCTMAFRRNVLETALPFPDYGVAHDLWLGMTASHKYRISVINEALTLYRRHDLTVTKSAVSNNNGLRFKLAYRLFILKNLPRLFFQKA